MTNDKSRTDILAIPHAVRIDTFVPARSASEGRCFPRLRFGLVCVKFARERYIYSCHPCNPWFIALEAPKKQWAGVTECPFELRPKSHLRLFRLRAGKIYLHYPVYQVHCALKL